MNDTKSYNDLVSDIIELRNRGYEYIFNENSPVIPNEAWENGDIDYNGCELKSQFGWYEEVFVRKDP